MGLKEGQGFESSTFQVDFWALKLFHILMTYRGIYTCIKVAFKTKKLAKQKFLIGGSHTTVAALSIKMVYFRVPISKRLF